MQKGSLGFEYDRRGFQSSLALQGALLASVRPELQSEQRCKILDYIGMRGVSQTAERSGGITRPLRLSAPCRADDQPRSRSSISSGGGIGA